MRDFRAFVRAQVTPLALPPAHEDKIVDEWAAQLEDVYDGLRLQGLTDDHAWEELQRQIPDWRALGAEVLETEPAIVRLANAAPAPFGIRIRHAIGAGREQLTRGLLRDIRAGVRLLFKDPGFSATVILTLAICLGANAAIFTIVDSVLLRPLPIPDSHRIVGMGDVYPTITPNDILSNDVPSYFDRRKALTTLEEQGMFTFWFDTVVIDGIPQELRGMRVTPSLFGVLKVSPVLGRAFADAEAEVGNDRKIILSYALWQQLYGGRADVLGKGLRLGWTGQPYTIVGVMPRGFSVFDQGYDGHALTGGVQFWIPLAFTPEQRSDAARTRYGYFHIGRLRPEASLQQLQAQLDALHAANVARFPEFSFTELGMYPTVAILQEALTRRVRRTLYLLWAGAAFVLLIGAINVANLSLARANGRRRELATRIALGAGRLLVVRQLVVEAILPSVLGGAGAIVVATGIIAWLKASGLENLPNAGGISINLASAAFALLVSTLVGALIGLVQATATRARSINVVLADGSRVGTSGRSARLFRRGLVVTQVALSVVLLIGATLLFASFRHLLSVDAGFRPTGVVTATIFPPPSRYPDARSVIALQDRVLERVRSIPGVEAAGLTSNIALSGFESPSTVSVLGRPDPADRPAVPSVVSVTPGYFETMGTPLVRGRFFDQHDRENTLRVALIDERLAARLFPSEDPLGRQILRGESGPYTIVGIVREVRLEALAGSIESIGTAYFPHTQAPPMRRLRWIAVKSPGEATAVVSALRTAMLDVDRDLPLSDVQTMNERTAHSVVSQRLALTLAATFGLVALFLSVLGIYGVLANLVARRTREIGIRMALGSSVAGVFRLVLGEGAFSIGAGLLIGLAGAIAMGRTLEGMLFGVRPTDPLLLLGVAIATGSVALLACIAPARRATRVNPVEVLSQP